MEEWNNIISQEEEKSNLLWNRNEDFLSSMRHLVIIDTKMPIRNGPSRFPATYYHSSTTDTSHNIGPPRRNVQPSENVSYWDKLRFTPLPPSHDIPHDHIRSTTRPGPHNAVNFQFPQNQQRWKM